MTAGETRVAGALRREFCRLDPAGAARELDRLPLAAVVELLSATPAREIAPVVERLTPDTGAGALARLEPSDAAKLVEAMDPALSAHLLARLPQDARDRLLGRLAAADAEELRQLMAYPPGTAGALMDPEVLALRPGATVASALERLRALGGKRIHRVYLIDPERRLLGAVSIRDLALASPATPLERLETKPPLGVHAMATNEEVVEVLTRARAASLPVTDLDGRLLGVLSQDALVEATREDATAGLQSMVGAGKEERALSNVGLAVRKRLPWLQVNLATAFLAAAVVGLFEQTIARYTALAVLLPVVAGQSGNTGAQAQAVTMRGLALREIRARQWLRVCFKETKVGAINGLAVALTTALGVFVWSRSTGLALVIGSSMVLAMVAAGFAGAAVPMALTALRQDPAQSSSIILTTITDVTGFLSFLGIATLLLELL